MTKSKLTQLPPLKDIIADTARLEGDKIWFIAANSAIVREYVSGWLEWFTDNRSLFKEAENSDLHRKTFSEYAKIVGQYEPWFVNAIKAVKDYDPDTQKPILGAYFAATMEVLGSLGAYQNYFGERMKEDPRSDINQFINVMIENSASKKSGPYLFDAFAGAYEHSFCFLFKMLSQFQNQYERQVTPDEYDQLTKQLTRGLLREAFLSRKENAIFEIFFSKTDKFFSFEETNGVWKLGTSVPSDQQKVDTWAHLEARLPPEERRMQELHAVPHHYGCPAAVHTHTGKSPISFVAEEVFGAIRKALWHKEDLNIEPKLTAERNLRQHLGIAPHQ